MSGGLLRAPTKFPRTHLQELSTRHLMIFHLQLYKKKVTGSKPDLGSLTELLRGFREMLERVKKKPNALFYRNLNIFHKMALVFSVFLAILLLELHTNMPSKLFFMQFFCTKIKTRYLQSKKLVVKQANKLSSSILIRQLKTPCI